MILINKNVDKQMCPIDEPIEYKFFKNRGIYLGSFFLNSKNSASFVIFKASR